MSKPKPVIIKPGQKIPVSGQYAPIGSRGGRVGKSEVTLVKRKTAPPTPEPGQRLKLVDKTK